jgi:hypothetical protein
LMRPPDLGPTERNHLCLTRRIPLDSTQPSKPTRNILEARRQTALSVGKILFRGVGRPSGLVNANDVDSCRALSPSSMFRAEWFFKRQNPAIVF